MPKLRHAGCEEAPCGKPPILLNTALQLKPSQQQVEEEESEDSSSESSAPPTARRRPNIQANDSDSASISGVDDDLNEQTAARNGSSSRDQMVKKMVRLALSCEYARQPIKRTEIGPKVLGEHGGRQFKAVFELANKELRRVFGMEMVELPIREKVTASQKRGELIILQLLLKTEWSERPLLLHPC